MPAANAVAAQLLARLAFHLDRDDFRQRRPGGDRGLGGGGHAGAAGLCPEPPGAGVPDAEPVELAYVGAPGDPALRALQRAVAGHFLPDRIVGHHDPAEGPSALPLLANKTLVGGASALYVCRHFACRQPVTSSDEVPAALCLAAQSALYSRPLRVRMRRIVRLAVLATLLAAPLNAQDAAALPAGYARWEAMIPMRDGVRLHTVFLAPADTTVPAPILMERTPYGTAGWGEGARFATAYDAFLPGGYVLVQQDIRGRYASEGQFIMNRPPAAPGDSSQVDESTDTYDTIEWMIHHVPGNNGRVGILGISYPGWLSAMAGYHPHPALKAISPQAPMGDAWMGDDFFHQGAFRQSYGLEYAWAMEASDDWSKTPNVSRYDTYEWYLLYPNLRAMAAAVGADAWPTWRNFVAHPSYDAFWQRHDAHVLRDHTRRPHPDGGGLVGPGGRVRRHRQLRRSSNATIR